MVVGRMSPGSPMTAKDNRQHGATGGMGSLPQDQGMLLVPEEWAAAANKYNMYKWSTVTTRSSLTGRSQYERYPQNECQT